MFLKKATIPLLDIVLTYSDVAIKNFEDSCDGYCSEMVRVA